VHSVVRALESGAAREHLHVRDVDAVDCCAVVGEEGSEGATDDFRAVDYGDCAAVEAVSVGEDGVVDAEVLEDLYGCEGGAGKDGLQRLSGVEEADVLVEVEDVAVGETFDVFVESDKLLDVAILGGAEDGVVDEDAVDGGVGVGGLDGVFEFVLGDGLKIKREAAGVGLVGGSWWVVFPFVGERER
jgi:hypothetical protein